MVILTVIVVVFSSTETPMLATAGSDAAFSQPDTFHQASPPLQRVNAEKRRLRLLLQPQQPPARRIAHSQCHEGWAFTTASPTLETKKPEIDHLQPSLDQPALFLSLNELVMIAVRLSSPGAAMTRLTAGSWDDITPLQVQMGSSAFASNRDGAGYLHPDLATGRLVYPYPEYDASPSWSPDGLWLVYETYTTTLTTLAKSTG
jgi:hypothetical protein